MSFFSFSSISGRRSYHNPHYGGRHYKQKGLFGVLGSLLSSFSHRPHGYYQQGGYPHSGQPLHQPLSQNHAPQGTSFCPNCGSQVPSGSKFCLECGAKMMSTSPLCSGCGQPIPANAKFCPNCGTPKR